jgi:hypothetical protein
MLSRIQNIPSRSIAIFLIVVLGLFCLNNIVYNHKHRLKDGSLIAHAHPYNKSGDTNPLKSHQHTTGELVFLANLHFFILAPILVFIFLVALIKLIFVNKSKYFKPQNAFLFCQERGPPFMV